jgi:hypothetical protein
MASPTAETMYTPYPLVHKGSLDKYRVPLHEKLQQIDRRHGNAFPELPPPTATPAEVADFLVRLLVVATEMPIDRARRIASRWTLGSGKELRDYPAMLYLDVFGKEYGWITYPAVKRAIHKENNKDFWYRSRLRKYSQSNKCRKIPT